MAKYISYLCVFLLIGCATYQASQRKGSLEETLLAYEDALFAGQYRAANKFRSKQGRDEQTPDFKHLKNIKVSSYKLLDSNRSPDGLKVELTVEIEYFHANHLKLKTFIDEQLWEYDAEEKHWYLHSDLPDLR
jgi:hypothetical protein